MQSVRLRTALSLSLVVAVQCATSPALAARLPVIPLTSNPTTIYASVSGAGVFNSADFGASWQGPAPLPTPTNARALVAGDLQGRTLYTGLSGGVYASHDSGKTWTATSRNAHSTYALVVNSRRASVVLAGTDRGLYRSDDSGATWSVAGGITRTVTALAQVPQGAGYVAVASGVGRVWKSLDGGLHWYALGRGLPARASITGLAVSATSPMTVFAATSQGIFLKGSGNTWLHERHGLPSKAFTTVVVDSAHVFAVSSDDNFLYLSTDGGLTWSHRVIPGLTGGVTALVQDASNPNELAVGDGNGTVILSSDAGLTWNNPSNGTVAGTVGSPVLALALVHPRVLPSQGVVNPHSPDVQWYPNNGGHTLRGDFLTYWQANQDAVSLIGYPLTEQFIDFDHGGVPAQYFERMELLQQGNQIVPVVPAPLGAEQVPLKYASLKATIDPHFQAFWSSKGGMDLFGPAVSPAYNEFNNDGTGNLYLVQYFRNVRLEYHPEAPSTGNTVQVGLLGEQALQALQTSQ